MGASSVDALLADLALARTEGDALDAGARFVRARLEPAPAAVAWREGDIVPGATCVNLCTSAGGSRSDIVGRLFVSRDGGRAEELRACPVFGLCCDAIAARVLFLRNGEFAWAVDEGAAPPRRASSEKFEDVTVVFMDIVKFTEACSQQDPAVVYDWVDCLFGKFDLLCTKYDMYKTKTVGDAYVATSGMMGTRRSDAGHALRFAVEAHRAAADTPACGGAHLTTLRVGIHTGTVAAGPIGSARDTFCMLGDAARAAAARPARGSARSRARSQSDRARSRAQMNTASRMETSCPPGAIRLSSTSLRGFDFLRDTLARSDVELKGLGQVETYLATSDAFDAIYRSLAQRASHTAGT